MENNPSKLRKLYPKILLPPIEVILKNKERKIKAIPKNRVLRFFKLYFGEGL